MAPKPKTSILPLNGVIQVTGFHDTGKTTFALECGVSPDRICFFDSDIKGRATVQDLLAQGITLGAYHDLTALSDGKKPLQYHEAVMALINSIEPGQFDCIIFDPWEVGNTTHDYVTAKRAQFRDSWSPNGKIKGSQEWAVARDYEGAIIGRLSNLAPTVILVTHLRPMYVNNARVPGKEVPGGSKILERVCRLRLWLTQNPNGSPVPVGLVLKRIDKKSVVGGRLKTVSVLPRKITPTDSETSLWETIERYWSDPIGLRPANPSETPDDFEVSLMEGTLTPEQRRLFNVMLDTGLVDSAPIDTLDELDTDVIDQVRNLFAQGIKPALIAAQLSIPLPQVLDLYAAQLEAA